MINKLFSRLAGLGVLVSFEALLYKHDGGIMLEFLVVNLFGFMFMTMFSSDKSHEEMAELELVRVRK